MPPTKNKRGDRGSVEGELEAAKRFNMADAHQVSQEKNQA